MANCANSSLTGKTKQDINLHEVTVDCLTISDRHDFYQPPSWVNSPRISASLPQ